MNLQVDAVSQILQGLAIGAEDRCMAACHVKTIHAQLDRSADSPDDLAFRPRANDGRAHADDADPLATMG